MRIRTHLDLYALQSIAEACDVRLVERQSSDVSEPTVVKRGVDSGKYEYSAVSLRPIDVKDADGNRPWQRISAGWGQNERRVFAVCWHGHATFMRTLFRYDASARITSSVGDWKGADDFMARHVDSAMRNIGAPIMSITMGEACSCEYQCSSYSDCRDVPGLEILNPYFTEVTG